MPSQPLIGNRPSRRAINGQKRARSPTDSRYAANVSSSRVESVLDADAARQALRAFVLVSHPEPTHHARGRTEVLELCKRNPPITEPEAIYQLQDALRALDIEPDGERMKLWERATTAKANDKDLLMRWINQAIGLSDWRSAQKV